MNKRRQNLSSLPITALLDAGIDQKEYQPWYAFRAGDQLVTLGIHGLVVASMTRSLSARYSDSTEIIEVKSLRRVPLPSDLERLGYSWSEFDQTTELSWIGIYGDLTIEVWCDDYSWQCEPLSARFGWLILPPDSESRPL